MTDQPQGTDQSSLVEMEKKSASEMSTKDKNSGTDQSSPVEMEKKSASEMSAKDKNSLQAALEKGKDLERNEASSVIDASAASTLIEPMGTQNLDPVEQRNEILEIRYYTRMEGSRLTEFYSTGRKLDLVVFNLNDKPNGFGFVYVNEESTFGTDPDLSDGADELFRKLGTHFTALMDTHTAPMSSTNQFTSEVRYLQFNNLKALKDHKTSAAYFEKEVVVCDYKLVALFTDQPSGFGFINEVAHEHSKKSRKYLVDLHERVEELRKIIADRIKKLRSQGQPSGSSGTATSSEDKKVSYRKALTDTIEELKPQQEQQSGSGQNSHRSNASEANSQRSEANSSTLTISEDEELKSQQEQQSGSEFASSEDAIFIPKKQKVEKNVGVIGDTRGQPPAAPQEFPEP